MGTKHKEQIYPKYDVMMRLKAQKIITQSKDWKEKKVYGKRVGGGGGVERGREMRV